MKIPKLYDFPVAWIGFLCVTFSCKSLNPTANLPLTPPPPTYSRVNVPLDIPLQTLSNLANQALPSILFSGEKMDLGNDVHGDLSFTRAGMIQIKALDAERFEVMVPVEVSGEVGLRPGGLRNLFQNRIPIQQQLNPVIRINPELAPNWGLGLSSFELSDLGGKMGLEIMGMQLDLTKLITQQINQYAAQNLVGKSALVPLKPIVDQTWSQVGKPVVVELPGKSQAFSIQPDSVRWSEEILASGQYRVNLGLSGQVNAHPADAAPSRAFPLPDLTENTASDNVLEVRIPIFLRYEELNTWLNQSFQNQRLRINRTTTFQPSNFQTQAYGERLGIWMDFVADQEGKEAIDGRLFLVGKPVFDPDSQDLVFREVNFYLDSDSRKARTAASLKKRKITRQLSQRMRFPLEDTFQSSLGGLEERLQIQTPYVDLGVNELEVLPAGFYPEAKGLTIHLQATGQVKSVWK